MGYIQKDEKKKDKMKIKERKGQRKRVKCILACNKKYESVVSAVTYTAIQFSTQGRYTYHYNINLQ
jgi:hypothetical protein